MSRNLLPIASGIAAILGTRVPDLPLSRMEGATSRPFVPTTFYPSDFKPNIKHPEKGRSLRIGQGLDSGVGSGPRRLRGGLTGNQVRKARKKAMKARMSAKAEVE